MRNVTPLTPPPEFTQRAAALGIEFEPGDVDRLGSYLALLLEANTHFNLTAITEPSEAWLRHILDSLTLVPYVASLPSAEPHEADAGDSPAHTPRVIDVGSGGGLPGIPLAITLPHVEFTLLEATGKKARFLHDVAKQLNLHNVTVIGDRAETIGQQHKADGHREQYDLAIARAVGRLPVLLELTIPLVKVGGNVLAMKGEKALEEIAEAKQAMHLLHSHVIETVDTPSGTIVIIEKMRKTPRTYPRNPGEPKRAPLGGKPPSGARS